ncbi:hypothetical protein [Amycolatopsis sp. PS_44_ISF1]|uniref:hypothetical protein n=1 Tax=Amycolatopsis sp. PS_44_ISF1 TaxID=2974917 RepID=UPI0028DD5C33|nr:hypothetical protein [Amycolatopsis sp. PS_44_ISF1]MDT8912270.1 hypothetical protein [Amycolatopsis sp. PS_44_ISF1]
MSADGNQWATLYSATTGTGGNRTLPVPGSDRHVRLTPAQRATQWGVLLWKLQVFGDGSAQTCGSTNAALRQPVIVSSVQSDAFPVSAAFDGGA